MAVVGMAWHGPLGSKQSVVGHVCIDSGVRKGRGLLSGETGPSGVAPHEPLVATVLHIVQDWVYMYKYKCTTRSLPCHVSRFSSMRCQSSSEMDPRATLA